VALFSFIIIITTIREAVICGCIIPIAFPTFGFLHLALFQKCMRLSTPQPNDIDSLTSVIFSDLYASLACSRAIVQIFIIRMAFATFILLRHHFGKIA
jgi:hypothetical protein